MQIKLKTAQDVVYHVDAAPSDTVGDVKALLEEQDGSLKADGHRIIFSGRVLEESASLGSSRISDGHVLLVVPRMRRSHGDECESGSLRQEQERAYAMLPRLQRRPLGYDPEAAFTVHVGGNSLVGTEINEGIVAVREGDAMDLVLGVTVGAVMGGLAALCLIEATLSARFKLGVVVGISCHVTFTVMRIVMGVPAYPGMIHDV